MSVWIRLEDIEAAYGWITNPGERISKEAHAQQRISSLIKSGVRSSC